MSSFKSKLDLNLNKNKMRSCSQPRSKRDLIECKKISAKLRVQQRVLNKCRIKKNLHQNSNKVFDKHYYLANKIKLKSKKRRNVFNTKQRIQPKRNIINDTSDVENQDLNNCTTSTNRTNDKMEDAKFDIPNTTTNTKTLKVSAITDVCFDFQNHGLCKRGSRCRFGHVAAHRSLCLDWKQGSCMRGVQCRFAHRYGDDIIEPTPRVKSNKKMAICNSNTTKPSQLMFRSSPFLIGNRASANLVPRAMIIDANRAGQPNVIRKAVSTNLASPLSIRFRQAGSGRVDEDCQSVSSHEIDFELLGQQIHQQIEIEKHLPGDKLQSTERESSSSNFDYITNRLSNSPTSNSPNPFLTLNANVSASVNKEGEINTLTQPNSKLKSKPLKPGVATNVCFDFQNKGHCDRTNCRFSHIPASQSYCIEFRKHGKCNRGSHCKWKHDLIALPNSNYQGKEQVKVKPTKMVSLGLANSYSNSNSIQTNALNLNVARTQIQPLTYNVNHVTMPTVPTIPYSRVISSVPLSNQNSMMVNQINSRVRVPNYYKYNRNVMNMAIPLPVINNMDVNAFNSLNSLNSMVIPNVYYTTGLQVPSLPLQLPQVLQRHTQVQQQFAQVGMTQYQNVPQISVPISQQVSVPFNIYMANTTGTAANVNRFVNNSTRNMSDYRQY